MRSTINLAFRRATRGLAHPVSMGAVVVLLLNDHWLRWAHPSWVTGKLGDAAWLIFSPLIAALVVAWIVPRGLTGKWHERVVGWVSFGGIGTWFALAKTVPFVHGWTLDALEGVTGWRGTLLMDASDLLTLPALCIGWWVWQRVEHETADFRLVGWAALGLGVMGSVANSVATPPFSMGLSCLHEIDNRIVIFITGSNLVQSSPSYASDDGGLTWRAEQYAFPEDCGLFSPHSFMITEPNTSVIFRFGAGNFIERSQDNGFTWRIEFDLASYFSEPQRVLYPTMMVPGPFDAIFDANTHNLIVAMGYQGVLVRDSNGIWTSVDVGPFGFVNPYTIEAIVSVLQIELGLMVVGMLLLVTYMLPINQVGWNVFFGVMAWLLWTIGVLYPPSKTISYSFFDLRTFTPWCTFGAFIIGLILFFQIFIVVANLLDKENSLDPFKMYFLRILGITFLAGIIFLTPFLGWHLGVISDYGTARFWALLLSIVFIAAVSMPVMRGYKLGEI